MSKSEHKKNTFFCNTCNYHTNRKSNYNRHINSTKHIEANNNIPIKNVLCKNKKKKKASVFICLCGKEYAYSSGLSKHKRKCSHIKSIEDDKKKEEKKKCLLDKIIQSNKTMQEFISKNIENKQPIINNTIINNNYTNQINFNIFLNENYKDAMNISEFIESIDYDSLSWDELKNEEAIKLLSNIIISNLQNIDIKKRPIHCTDTMNNQMYIKDQDLWEKDESNEKIKKTIQCVSNKQKAAYIKNINEMKEKDKLTNTNNNKEYIKKTNKYLKPINDIDERQIIKQIANSTILTKNEGESDETIINL